MPKRRQHSKHGGLAIRHSNCYSRVLHLKHYVAALLLVTSDRFQILVGLIGDRCPLPRTPKLVNMTINFLEHHYSPSDPLFNCLEHYFQGLWKSFTALTVQHTWRSTLHWLIRWEGLCWIIANVARQVRLPLSPFILCTKRVRAPVWLRVDWRAPSPQAKASQMTPSLALCLQTLFVPRQPPSNEFPTWDLHHNGIAKCSYT